MTASRPTDRLELLLDGMAAGNNIRSAVFALSSGDGTLDWSGARGEIEPGGGPMTPTTPWFTASITKLFIASSVMRLVEEGTLTLGDRMVDHLPTSITEGLHVLGGTDRTHLLTVEHLLGHTSGLADFIEDHPHRRAGDPDGGRSLVEILQEDGDRSWTLEQTAQRVRERLRPHFPPGDLDRPPVRIRYSDTNYQLLIGIVEALTGDPFHRVLETLFLDPLELRDTWVPGHPRHGASEPAVATLYAGTERVVFPRFFASIADLNSTCHDLLRFLKAVCSGRAFGDPGSWPRMQAHWNRFSLPRDRAALRQPGWPIEYGLGVMRFQLPRPFTPLRRMPNVVGHTGSTGTWLFHAPELDLYLTGAVSQIHAGAVPFRFVPKVLRVLQETGR